jgi:hypothetical protein
MRFQIFVQDLDGGAARALANPGIGGASPPFAWSPGYQPGSTQVVASSVRSCLRFRALRHADAVEALLTAIPKAARRRLASLPLLYRNTSTRRNSPTKYQLPFYRLLLCRASV